MLFSTLVSWPALLFSLAGPALATDGAIVAKTVPAGCEWAPGFTIADIAGSEVNALAVHDDGNGPALYAAGNFRDASGVWVNEIAKWDGDTWSALAGASGPGVSSTVNALAVYDDGSGPALYAAGNFRDAGGESVNKIAKWDGSTWSALAGPSGTGTDDIVEALAVYDDGGGPALYAGGSFTTAGGLSVSHVAKWDGVAWSALAGPSGTGTDGIVEALVAYDAGGGPALYAGGSFTTAGGLPVSHVAKWDGSAWSALTGPSGTGTDGTVETLAVNDHGAGAALYAGGSFTTAGGVVADRVARWDGGSWSALAGPSGTGTDDTVVALAVYDDGAGPALYAGGSFTTAGGVMTANRIAKWDGVAWSAPAGPPGTSANGDVHALAVYDDGSGAALYVGGRFVKIGGVAANKISQWNGSSWSALSEDSGAGIPVGDVLAWTTYDDGGGTALYGGGSFITAGGVVVDHVAKWDGSFWSALAGPAGTGTDGTVFALTVYDDGTGAALYAGGSFTTAGGVAVNNVARWDAGWSPVGAGTDGTVVYALAVYDDGSGAALYAGGTFSTAGGVLVNRIAKWDGSTWSALAGPAGTGTDGHWVSALAVYDDGDGMALYASGSFSNAGGILVNEIAKWDGSTWSALSDSLGGIGVIGSPNALAVYDDGGGPALYVGGDFSFVGGWVHAERIAKWDGSSWSALGSRGVSDWVNTLTTFDDGRGAALYVGGAFIEAPFGTTVNFIARWDGSSWSTLAGPAGIGTSGNVEALGGYDDGPSGSGSALYVGGGFSRAGGLPSSRVAKYSCLPTDFGDAPDPPYPTVVANDGAWHTIDAALYLGVGVDADLDGQEDAAAQGDDKADSDDEDGVAFLGHLTPGRHSPLAVTASQAGLLDAWIDWNNDGDWSNGDEKIFSARSLGAGSNRLTFTVPAGASPGTTFARFRFSSAGTALATGAAPDGEVEDYQVTVSDADVFADGFESGNTAAWSQTVPPPP